MPPKSKFESVPYKICSKCGEQKDKSEFHYNICKQCRIKATLAWREKNPEASRKHAKTWYENNKDYANSKKREWREANIAAVKERDRQYCKEHREKRVRYHKAYHLRRGRWTKYSITPEQGHAMLVAQNNKCAICKNELTKSFHIDHCHITQKVRGLLCGACNKGIGILKENINTLQNAIVYLQTTNPPTAGTEILHPDALDTRVKE